MYRITYGLTEFVQLLSVRHQIQRSTDIGTQQPKFDSVVRQPSSPMWVSIWEQIAGGEQEAYSDCGRRTPTVPKMALAGVMVEDFSARSSAPMAAFKAEIVLCRSLGRWVWDSACMAENGCNCEGTAWCEGCEELREP